MCRLWVGLMSGKEKALLGGGGTEGELGCFAL